MEKWFNKVMLILGSNLPGYKGLHWCLKDSFTEHNYDRQQCFEHISGTRFANHSYYHLNALCENYSRLKPTTARSDASIKKVVYGGHMTRKLPALLFALSSSTSHLCTYNLFLRLGYEVHAIARVLFVAILLGFFAV